jgi:membrane protein implicated in regulation of membrane protease activity
VKASAPPLAVVGAQVAGLGINWWVAAATLAYIVLQGAYLIWKWRKEAKKK